LQPDVVIDQRDRTIVLDAKYKAHWEEIDQRGWRNLRDDLRSRHRKDLLQALAYGNLPSTDDVTVCLLYPCRPETWSSLKERGRTAHVADISSGLRQLNLVLGAVPMAERVTEVAEHVAEWLPTS
jgi:5-methylcytosine-specific restriction endonuclease McrBC regulatory subunit McrC